MHFERYKGVSKTFFLPVDQRLLTDKITLFIEANKAVPTRLEGQVFYRHFARNQASQPEGKF